MPSYTPRRRRLAQIQTATSTRGTDALVPRKPNPQDPGFYRDQNIPGPGKPQKGSLGNIRNKDTHQALSPNLKNILTFNETHEKGKEIGAFNATHTKGKATSPDLIQKLKAMKDRRRKKGPTSVSASPQSYEAG